MKITRIIKPLAGMIAALASSAVLAASDTVQYSTGYFVDSSANTYSSPYYRWAADDWSWTHSAMSGSFSSASLWVSAWDVDAPDEVDNIYAWDSGSWTLLGSLAGANDAWGYSTFALGSNFFDDIATGLKVKIDIDSTSDGWAVTLAKSVLTVDGGYVPPPNPTAPVPEPETYAMMLAGLGLMGVMIRRRRNKSA